MKYDTIKMDLGTDKCVVLHLKRGKVSSTENMTLMDNTSMPALTNQYKYRGLNLNASENIYRLK